MYVPQRRQDIAAGVDEGLHAGCMQDALASARPSRQIDMLSASVFQGSRSIRGLARIDLVRRAQASELGAGGFECLDHRVAGGEAVVAYCLDTAAGEEILGE